MCQGTTTEVRMRAAASANMEFAAAATHVANEEFRAAAAQLSLQGLIASEGHGKSCVQFLLAALHGAASAGSSAMHDAVWMLQRLAQRSESSRNWILEAGGAEVVHAALLTRPGDDKLAQAGARLAYLLDGLRGLADLLCRSRSGSTPGHEAVRAAVAWAVFELVRCERSESPQAKPESACVLAVLIEVMGHEASSTEGQWACCSALDAMVKEEPRLGALFIDGGGARLLLRALRKASGMGAEGEDFRRAVAYLITSLADGSQQAANALRAEGALRVLAEVALQGSGRDVEAAMWALGSLGGIGTVLEAMSKQGPSRPAVLRGGVVALCECAWNAVGDKDELSRLPVALALLLECLAQEEAAAGDFLTECTTALGSVLASLAPHAPPGRLPDVDRGVEALLKRLHATPTLQRGRSANGASGSPVGSADQEAADDGAAARADTTAEKAAEAIGRIALGAPEWRRALRHCGALEALAGWIRCGGAPRRLQKYLFWAAAAIAGLPFVANELRLHMGSVEAVDAGLCTIVDILDDDIDSEYALAGVECCADAELPAVLALVVDTMKMHPGAPEVQYRACHCVGLLVPLIPNVQALALAAAGVAAASAAGPVAAAARRFPRRLDVVRGACCALRALLGLVPMYAGAEAATGHFKGVAQAVMEEGCVDCAEEALEAFAGTASAEELLEDAAAALALGRGLEAVLPKLAAAPQGSPLREAGLKGLFEVARGDLRILVGGDPGVAQLTGELCARLAAEEPSDHGNRVREVAALLAGLCGRGTPTQAGA